ncbi:G-protein-signaling modulator 2 [Condylostylus longicornis]|uniref:G-protein-signaling modulator 2 n=1 Tax=Condylostylus longicornis TaxID=2530218 RepID=UPI00244E0EEC|nr:G-protein-signaling modulator 2 [Condylostylus longicornis]
MSFSASAENLLQQDKEKQSNDASSMCLELALEGERLCKAGDCRSGIAFFQAAIQAGTDDLRTLSAIYSQLGNAFFYMGDYTKAMKYHKLDLTLARSINDRLGEAKSSGNLGNTLKIMGKFDEAVLCCDRHLVLSRQLGDRLSEARALYNLGNVYHAKGKHYGQKSPGDFADIVKESLEKAVEYYKQNLNLMKELGDRGAQGRAYGNLGNTYYLLGNFKMAIEHHEERLRIAKEFGDKAAERRANSNLGNSHIFLGQFEEAAEHYRRTLALAVELGEKAIEAQACYSLGNTYTLLRDFKSAINYHNRHLDIARLLGDKIGEARACWSLGNAHSAEENHEKALQYAEEHHRLAVELTDQIGESTAKINIIDLRKILGLPEWKANNNEILSVTVESNTKPNTTSTQNENASNIKHITKCIRVRRQSMEQLDLIKITPDGKRSNSLQESEEKYFVKPEKEDDFFEMLSRSQSKRMDDQRCSMLMIGKDISQPHISSRKPLIQQNTTNDQGENKHNLLEMIADLQSERMDEQRAILPGLKKTIVRQRTKINGTPDDEFLDMLMRCQRSRIEEQRSELPQAHVTMDAEALNNTITASSSSTNAGATVPDEDFFSFIMKVQSGRMEDQRATIPKENSSKPKRSPQDNFKN